MVRKIEKLINFSLMFVFLYAICNITYIILYSFIYITCISKLFVNYLY